MTPFLFAIHSHQPVGNFDHIFERGLDDSYQPFLELLAKHPRIKVAIHYSGCLLEWIEAQRQDHVELLRELVTRGQVEIVGGGFYEPILPIIPERDARDQIRSYADHLDKLFGKRPRGLWLTERVWDPRLPELLHDVGVAYTLVDDSHFRYAGVEPEDVWGPFLTESRGKSVAIFPIDQKLRYIIPFREPEETVAYIRDRAAAHPGFMACYGDDGEKFGMWPGTKEWVFEKGWLTRFFTALEAVADEIAFTHFSDYLDAHEPRRRIYLPPASYDEMMEWVLPPDLGRRLADFKHELKDQGRWEELAPFVRGGHWDMFLAKYEESNRMHKRMLLASERLARLDKIPADAHAHLLRSQCNCAYWHGVFGGLYLNYLRHAVYEQVLLAEDRAGVIPNLKIEKLDYDLDGAEDILVSSPDINAFISPRQGGSVVALEYPLKHFALGNVLGRRPEAYHAKLAQLAEREQSDAPATIHDELAAKEPGLEKLLVTDRFGRNSLQDHLVPADLTLEAAEKELVPAIAPLAGAAYFPSAVTANSITLERRTAADGIALRLEKTIRFAEGRAGFAAAYLLTADGPLPSAQLAIEFNLTLLAGDAPDRYVLVNGEKPEASTLNAREDHPAVSEVALVDEAFGFRAVIKPKVPCRLLRFPVETVSQSESGYERNYQGTVLWLVFSLEPADAREWNLSLDFDLAPTVR